MELTGKFVRISEVKEVGAKAFKVRELVIDNTDNPEYPSKVSFQLTGTNIDRANNLKPGDMTEIKYNLTGREYEKDGKKTVFNSLNAWWVKKISDAPVGEAAADGDVPF